MPKIPCQGQASLTIQGKICPDSWAHVSKLSEDLLPLLCPVVLYLFPVDEKWKLSPLLAEHFLSPYPGNPFPLFHTLGWIDGTRFFFFFFNLHTILPMLRSSSSWPLIPDVESCQVLLKNQSVLCTATKSPSSFMTGISSRHSIQFVEHDLPCLGPCSLPSRKWALPGVLPPHPSRMLPRIPSTSPSSTPEHTRCCKCCSPIFLLVLRWILNEIWRIYLAIFKSFGITSK